MPEAAPVPEDPSKRGTVESVEPDRVQRTVARRYAEAKAIVPEHTLELDVDLEGAEGDPGIRLIGACGRALREHPHVNAAYRDARFERYRRVNVAFAVFAGGAVVTPTIFDADAKDAAQIAGEVQALAARVRDGSITQPELAGATFTAWDLGPTGADRGQAIITPPQAGALALGALRPRAVVHDGAVAARATATLTLTADHRILYGVTAGAFLARVGELLRA